MEKTTKVKLMMNDEKVDDDMTSITVVTQLSCPLSPVTLHHSGKSYERGYCVLSLLISDGIHPGLCVFFPQLRRFCFKKEMDIDITDILYSNGDWFLIREDNIISFWHVKLEERWHVTEVNAFIHHGYFFGSPPFDCMVVLASQHPPRLQNETETNLWIGSIKDDIEWQKKKVKCSYEDRGIHSIVMFQNMILWLTDDGSLCSVKKNSEEIQINCQKGACSSNTMNFCLVQHADKLYIVKSGGFLPYELPGIYEVILDSETTIQETTLYGKDIFVVHKIGGFVLQSDLDDCRIFTGSMLPDVECAMFSYRSNHNEKIMCCKSALHLSCNSVWVRLGTAQL